MIKKHLITNSSTQNDVAITRPCSNTEEFVYWLLTQQYYVLPDGIRKRAIKALDGDAINDYTASSS